MQLVVLAVVCGLGLRPHRLHNFNALAQHADAILGRRKVVSIAAVLVLIPSGANPPIESSTRNDINRRRDLGQQAWRAIAVAPNHLAEAHTASALANSRHRGPALEHCFVRRHRHIVEVVVEPDRVVPEFFGQHRNLNCPIPLRLGAVDRGQFHLPALRHEHTKRDITHEPTLGAQTSQKRHRQIRDKTQTPPILPTHGFQLCRLQHGRCSRSNRRHSLQRTLFGLS